MRAHITCEPKTQNAPMKILHTADWHIGKVLHKHPLQDELILFFNWLLTTIETEAIDLLLISGDVFDLANPSAKDRKLYYGFLKSLVNKDLNIIITGGNHDSVGFLNAPKDLLDELNITIIGGATDPIEDEIIEVKDKQGNIQLVVAAVPFLRDKDLRNSETDQKYKNRTEAIREGIKNHYNEIGEICKRKYPETPLIAMGHLYVIGVEASESERDIHVGNAAAIDSSAFPSCFDYVALGHIHRPQRISKNDFIRYSGSPIALSFSEKKDNKCVIVLELDKGKIKEPQVINLPKFRELKKFSGSLEEIQVKLQEYQPEFPLVSFVEIEVKEAEFSSLILSKIEDLKVDYTENDQFKILKGTTHFKTGAKDTSDLFIAGENIEDLSPMDVFSKRLESEQMDEEKVQEIKDAFLELLEIVEQTDES